MNTKITQKSHIDSYKQIYTPLSLKEMLIKNISATMKTTAPDIYEESIERTIKTPIIFNENEEENESHKAINILTNEKNIKFMQNICSLILDKVKNLESAVLSELNDSIYSESKNINFPRYITKNKIDDNIIEELEILSKDFKEDLIIHALSKLWFAVRSINKHFNPEQENQIKYVYVEYINSFGKSHTLNSEYSFIKKATLGDDEIQSSLLDNLDKLYKLSSRYVPVQYSSEDKPLLENHKIKNIKYLAGISGMCNCFYNIYSLLDIDFESENGKKIAEIISAFIVAIGFHTFAECYDSFNLTHYHVQSMTNTNSLARERSEKSKYLQDKIDKSNQAKNTFIRLEQFKKTRALNDYIALPDELKKDKEISMLAILNETSAFYHLPQELKENCDFVLVAIKQGLDKYKDLPKKLQENYDIAMAAVMHNGNNYYYLPESLKNKTEFASAAVEQYAPIYKKLPKNMQTNSNVAIKAILYDENNYHYLPESLKNEPKLALTTIEQNAAMYRDLSEKMKLDKDVAMLAVICRGTNYYHLPEHLKNESEFALAAIKQNASIYIDLPEELQSNHTIAMVAVNHNGNNYQYLPKHLKDKSEFASIIIQQNAPICEKPLTEMDSNHDIAIETNDTEWTDFIAFR